MSKEKVVLAYSGGLDTTAIIPWLKENFDYEVILLHRLWAGRGIRRIGRTCKTFRCFQTVHRKYHR